MGHLVDHIIPYEAPRRPLLLCYEFDPNSKLNTCNFLSDLVKLRKYQQAEKFSVRPKTQWSRNEFYMLNMLILKFV